MEINQQKSARPKIKRSFKAKQHKNKNKQALWCMLFYTVHAISTTETILY